MAEHRELLAEMPAVSRLSTPERLRHAQKRRAQQLKKWAQAEKEIPAIPKAGDERKRRRRKSEGGGKRVTFPDSVRLLEAAARNDVEEIRQLLESGISPDLCNEDGLTALHQSCIDASLPLALLLLDSGAAVDARDAELWTPLHAAAACGHRGLAQLLIQRGADLLAVNSDGNMAYDLCEDEATLERLESAMARRGITQERIEQARAAPERSMIQEIQDSVRNGTDLDEPLGHGATWLHVAAAHGYRAAAELLLQHRARHDARDRDGWQPLHAAACWGQVPLVDLLVSHGADPGARSLLDETPADVCQDEQLRARLQELQRRRAAALRAQETPTAPLQRRTSGAGSRGRLVRRASLAERSGRYRRQLRREGLVWQRGARGDSDDDEDTATTDGDRQGTTGTAEGTSQREGTGDSSPSPSPPPSPRPNGSALSPTSPMSPMSPASPPRCPPSPSGDRSHPQTLADLKRHRAAAKAPRNRGGEKNPGKNPETPRGDIGDIAGDIGDIAGDIGDIAGDIGDIGDTGEPRLLRLTAPPEEAPPQKQRCCRLM